MNNSKKFSKILSVTLTLGIIISVFAFGGVNASASCPLTNMFFGNVGNSSGLGNTGLGALFGNVGNVGNANGLGALFGNGNSCNSSGLGALFGNGNTDCPQNSNNCTQNSNNCTLGSNCTTANCTAGNNCTAGKTCTTANCPAGNACTTGNCPAPKTNSNTTSNNAKSTENNSTTPNNNVANNCTTNDCKSNCTDCNSCSDCTNSDFTAPAKYAFELERGYTYSLRLNMGGARNLTVKSSNPAVVTAQNRGTNPSGQSVIYLKTLATGSAEITICPPGNGQCETVYITVKAQNFSNSGNQNSSQNAQNNDTFAEEVLLHVNNARANNGLPALKLDDKLCAAAEVRAYEAGVNFSHTRPDGSSWMTVLRDFDVQYRVCGENIAMGYRDARAVVNAWMDSPGHRANILSPNYNLMGIGKNGNNWGQLFTN